MAWQRRRRLTHEEGSGAGGRLGVGGGHHNQRDQRRREENPKPHPSSLPHGSVTLTSTLPVFHVSGSTRTTCVPVLPSVQPIVKVVVQMWIPELFPPAS